MNDALSVYLQDHLAGAGFAIDLLEFMSEKYRGTPLGDFTAGLVVEVRQDRDTLRGVAEQIGSGGTTIKEVASWVSEKVSRIKLGHDGDAGLGKFEALEFLALGIQGKYLLWRVLERISPSDSRLSGLDLAALAERAQNQRDRVEQWRLDAGVQALQPKAKV
jgi:hypothetical protein